MKVKLICQTIVRFIKQLGLLPQTVCNAVLRHREQNVWRKAQIERLDRIRNPSKYLGK